MRYRAFAVSLLAAAATLATGASAVQAAPTTAAAAQAVSCSVTYPAWVVGYTAVVTVNGPTSGWSIPYIVPNGHRNTVVWGARASNGTASNLAWNGNLAAGQTATFGLVFTSPVGDSSRAEFPTCSS
jgi:hypothetical protein